MTMILDLAAAQRAIAEPKYRLQDYTGIPAVLSVRSGQTLGLDALREIEITAAMRLCHTAATGEPVETALWEMLVLRTQEGPLLGTAPEIADWITARRASGMAVILSAETELAVYADATSVTKAAEPRQGIVYLSGFDRKSYVEPIHCPFGGEEVGAIVNRNGDTWTKRWRHSPCPHVVSILSNGQPARMIPDVTRQRATPPVACASMPACKATKSPTNSPHCTLYDRRKHPTPY